MPRNRNRRLQPLLPQVGGTAVERWSSTEALGKCDQTRGSKMAVCKDSDEDEVAKARAAMKTTSGATGGGATYAKYGWKDEENAGAKNGAAEKRGESAYGFQNATLFNGMISPWVNTAVRGAVWYQGESNVACNDRWPYMQGLNCAMYVEHTLTYLYDS